MQSIQDSIWITLVNVTVQDYYSVIYLLWYEYSHLISNRTFKMRIFKLCNIVILWEIIAVDSASS